MNKAVRFQSMSRLTSNDHNVYFIDVPIDHLLKKSHVFNLVSNLKPYCNAKELIYVNSLRQFANGAIDVRFIVDPESSSTRSAVSGRRKRKPQSGYEVRRSDFASLKDSEFSRYSKSRWDALTVYMVNLLSVPYILSKLNIYRFS